jgi:hypothetical protein
MFLKKLSLPICNKYQNKYINQSLFSLVVKKKLLPLTNYAKNLNLVSSINLHSLDLVKPLIISDISWSSGMVSNLLFKFNVLESQKYSTPLSARKDW